MVRKPSEIIRGARKKAAKKRTKRKAKKLKKKRKKRRLKKKAVAKAEPVTSRVRSVADEASSTKREAKKLSDEVGLSGAGQSTGNVLDSASGAIDAARETLDDIEAGSSANNGDILDAVEGSQTDASFEATIDDGGMAIEEGGLTQRSTLDRNQMGTLRPTATSVRSWMEISASMVGTSKMSFNW